MFSPDSHDVIIIIVGKKRYTCAVASVQSPASAPDRGIGSFSNDDGNDKDNVS